MRQIYKFLYTIKQITKTIARQVARLSRQFDEKFYAIELNAEKNSCNSGESQKVERNDHGFPTNIS